MHGRELTTVFTYGKTNLVWHRQFTGEAKRSNMAHDVFLSHSVKDKAVAEAIVARLEGESVTCWIAPRDVVPGADWGESIIDAIESSRIMILIFSRNADASPQIKREVERAVNKGVYIIPFRVDDIPPTKSLEYFISTSQWMDAFSPPLERHLDNLARTVKAVLKTSPVSAATAPAEPEKPSFAQPPVLQSGRKVTLITITIAALVLVGGAGWYFGQKKKGASETPVVTTPLRVSKMINDEEVRNFVTSHYRAEERGDIDYMLSQYTDSFTWGRERRDKESRKNEFNQFVKQWPVRSFSVGQIRVVHSDTPDRVTAYFEYRFFYRDPTSGRSDSGHVSQEWVISKTSGKLKIFSARATNYHDSPAPSPLPTVTSSPPPPPP
jgi:TIR domain